MLRVANYGHIVMIIYLFIHIFFYMDRKLREISWNLIVTIPKQVYETYNFKAGDILSIEPIGAGELRLRKVG